MDINLQSAALLAYGKALSFLVKRRDVVFGHVVSGRSLPLPDVEQIIGPLFNTIPFRVRLDNILLTNHELATQVQQTVVDGQSHQHASLNTIQKHWRQSQIESDSSLLDALFVFQKASPISDGPKQELWKPFAMKDDRDSTEYGLNFELEQGLSEITLSASSPIGRLNSQDLDAFCHSFDTILRDILDSPSRSVTAYPEMMHDFPLSMNSVPAIKENTDFQDIADSLALAIIRGAFSKVSNISEEKIAVKTSIFSLGIDSISAIRVASICRSQNIQLSVADILQGRSLGGITRLIVSKNSFSSPREDEKITNVSTEVKDAVLSRLRYPASRVENVLPCLAGQAYHLASWLKSGRTFYEPTWSFVSHAKLDQNRLASAWHTLQESHSILRTVFVLLQSQQAYQVVLTPETLSNISFSTSEDSELLADEVKRQIKRSAHKPSALFNPAISLHLVQGKAQDAVLFKLHHSLYDAWTMKSLVSELSALYLHEPKASVPNFSDFVWHTQNAHTPSTEAAYWKSSLAHTELSMIPQREINASDPPYATFEQTFVWGKQVVNNLTQKTKICQHSGVALSTIVILAFSRVLENYTNTKCPTFGFFQAGRSASFPNTATVGGPCVNLLPFATPDTEERSDLDTALAIQDDLGRRVPFEQSHLRNVLAWKDGLDPSGPETKLVPLFNANLNLLWHGKKSINKAAAESLWKPLDIGVPTDFASEEPIPGETAVDGLETGYLAAQNLFVDVGPAEVTDSIDFGVKCDFSLMNEEMVRGFVERVAAEIERIVSGLEDNR